MKYYLKNAVLPFIYLFFMAITALGILTIKAELNWLKVILCALNLALYLVIAFLFAFKLGEDAVKVRNANDLERKQIILTGEDRPLKLHEEYKPFKGLIIGVMVCAPLILCMIIHSICFACGGTNVFGTIGSVVYLLVYDFFLVFMETSTAATYYWSLLAIPVIVGIVGLAYFMGGRKIELQYAKIEENQRKIYGDKV